MTPYRNHHYAVIVTDLSHLVGKNNYKRKNFSVSPLALRKCARELAVIWLLVDEHRVSACRPNVPFITLCVHISSENKKPRFMRSNNN